MSVFKVSEVKLSYKHFPQRSILPKISCAEHAFDILYNQWDENRMDFAEDFKILLLDRSKCVLGLCHISSGGVAGTVADPKHIFVAALLANASSIILAHNHPSGNLKPSEADKQLTQKIKKAGEFLDIDVADHIILTSKGYYSFAQDYDFSKNDSNTCSPKAKLPVLEL